MAERLHKVLAQHGLGSRRELERWITEGRITLNGRLARTGDAWQDGDRVELDGRDVTRRLERQVAMKVLAYHKPQGQPIAAKETRSAVDEAPSITEDIDSPGRDTFSETVMDRLPAERGSRWVAINPMHAGDSGLLLFTNDGALSHALTRQKKWIPTSYMVRVQVRGGLANAPALPTTVTMDDGEVTFTKVAVVGDPLDAEGETGGTSGNVWYRVDMPRADKRAAVRALFVSHHLSISRVMQVAFGPIALTRDMARARHVMLDDRQLEQLYSLAQLPLPAQPGVMTGKFSGKPVKRSGGRSARSTTTATNNEQPVKRGHAPSRRPRTGSRPDNGSPRKSSSGRSHGKRPSSRRS